MEWTGLAQGTAEDWCFSPGERPVKAAAMVEKERMKLWPPLALHLEASEALKASAMFQGSLDPPTEHTAHSLALSKCLKACWMNVGKSELFYSRPPCFQNSGLDRQRFFPSQIVEVLPKQQMVSLSWNLKNVPSLFQEEVKCRPSLSAKMAPNPWALSVPLQISRAHFKGGTHGFWKALWPHVAQSS